MSKKYSLPRSFGFAFSGIKRAILNEPNFRIHLLVAVVVSLLASFLKFSLNEWLILILVIFLVIAVELINTSIESIVNLVSLETKEHAKNAKDVSAAAVLVVSTLAIIVGALLFIPRILKVY